MVLSADYRRLLRKEVLAYSIIQKSFKKQKEFLLDNAEELAGMVLAVNQSYYYLNNAYVNLYPKKKWSDEYTEEPLGGFWREMGVDDMIKHLIRVVARSMEKGYKRTYRAYRKFMIENNINYYPDKISDYANYWGELNLSNYKGAITHTTKLEVVSVIKDGLDRNLSRSEIVKNIEAISEKLFSKARARTIAVTETHKAYEYGNWMPMKELKDIGCVVKKKWQTCDDSKVRPEHMACEELGWVDLDYTYPSVGVDIPPGGVNCRCTMLYNVD